LESYGQPFLSGDARCKKKFFPTYDDPRRPFTPSRTRTNTREQMAASLTKSVDVAQSAHMPTNYRFRERELERVARVARRIGGARVVVDPVSGTISIIVGGKPGETEVSSNDLDNWLAKRDKNAPQT
jgi:hypothetical protein